MSSWKLLPVELIYSVLDVAFKDRLFYDFYCNHSTLGREGVKVDSNGEAMGRWFRVDLHQPGEEVKVLEFRLIFGGKYELYRQDVSNHVLRWQVFHVLTQ